MLQVICYASVVYTRPKKVICPPKTVTEVNVET